MALPIGSRKTEMVQVAPWKAADFFETSLVTE
jgi:hypothetical protein